MTKVIAELFRYRTLVSYLVLLDLRTRYRGSVLGFLWTLLNPLLLMLVMWGVFSQFGRIDEENYALFLLAGLMSWTFFSQSVERGLGTIIANSSLLRQVYVPKAVFPLSIVTSNLLNFGFFAIAYFILAALTMHRIPATSLLLIPGTVMLYLLSTGATLLMCALNVFFRDFSHLTVVLMRVMFYATPIIYSPAMLGEDGQRLLRFNPATYPVVAIRDAVYYGQVSSPDTWTVGFAMATTVFVIGLAVFSATENRFVYYA